MKRINKYFAILLIKYLQKKYKSITLKNRHNRSNQVLNKLKLIQSILYYLKLEFQCYGYFHPDCCWSDTDEVFFRKLFPEKDFEELDIVIWHNPHAVRYYMNKIYKLTNATCGYEREIKKQLIEWKEWN